MPYKTVFGIDFGNANSLLFAPLKSFYGADSLQPAIRDFISCSLNKEESRMTASRILLENQERLIGLASSRSTSISNFKQNLGLFKESAQQDTNEKVNETLQQPTVTVPYGRHGQMIPFSAEQIAAMYLRKLIQNVTSPGDIPTSLHPIPQYVFHTEIISFLSFLSIIHADFNNFPHH